MFLHIENLPELIKNLKLICNDKTVIIIENHYLGDIISRGQFDIFTTSILELTAINHSK